MDHAASDEQIDHAGGMTERDGTALARVDTCDGALASVGHVLERRRAVPVGSAGWAGPAGPADPNVVVSWRLTLHRSTPSPVPGGNDPIELVGPRDGSVPRVLEQLIAGVTRGRALLPIGSADGSDERQSVEGLASDGRRTQRPRTDVFDERQTRVLPDATIEQTVQAIAARAARTLVGLDPHLRLDALPDDVHDANVAVRRIRNELHAFDHLLRPGRTERLRADLAWFGDVLGAVRDLDVVGDHLGAATTVDGGRPLRVRLRNQRRFAALVLRNSLVSPRMRRLHDELSALAIDPWFAKGVDPNRKVRRVALEAVRVTDRRVAAAVRSIGERADVDRLLDVRRRAKACRHVCELVAEPLVSDRLADAMYGVQTALGPLQDAVVIGAWLGAQHRPLLEVEAVGTVEAVAALAARADEQCRLAATSWPSAWVRAQADAVRPWIG